MDQDSIAILEIHRGLHCEEYLRVDIPANIGAEVVIVKEKEHLSIGVGLELSQISSHLSIVSFLDL